MYSKDYYNLFAIYLRWCMEHDLMGEDFLKEYGEVFKPVSYTHLTLPTIA